jgi:hypothetical protein
MIHAQAIQPAPPLHTHSGALQPDGISNYTRIDRVPFGM